MRWHHASGAAAVSLFTIEIFATTNKLQCRNISSAVIPCVAVLLLTIHQMCSSQELFIDQHLSYACKPSH